MPGKSAKHLFQSLFYWIFLSESASRLGFRSPGITHMFQSLFYWIFLSEGCPIISVWPLLAGEVFQSLFYWIFLSEFVIVLAIRLRPQTSVSILVLLDFPFGVNLENYTPERETILSFNPCSIGFSFRRLLGSVIVHECAYCFNPCSIGFSFRSCSWKRSPYEELRQA